MHADKDNTDFKHKAVTDLIISAFYTVYNVLGYGFLERVYVNSLVVELEKLGLVVKQQHPITVFYDGKLVGEYFADLLINNCI